MTLNMTALWDALGWAILHSLWQGALIGFVVWAIRTLATQRRAWLRYLAGMGGLVATFGAFLATFMILAISRVEKMAPIDQAGDLAGPSAASDLTLSISVLPLQASQSGLAEALVPWLGMFWAVGFAFLSLQGYRAYAATRWLATQGLRTPGDDWTARFTALIRRSGANEKIRLFVSEHVSGPMTLGALRPIVLVPAGFLTALPPAQIDAILLHELAHIRRHDFLFGLIQTAIRTVLYFNPAVVMMSRQIDEDREQACDDFAVSITGNATDLARGLAALRLGSQKPDLVMAADGGPLLARLNRLMGRPASRSASSRLTAAAISALMLGTAACSTVSMANPPEAPVAPKTAPEPVVPELPDTVVRISPDGETRSYAETPAPTPPAIPSARRTEFPELPAIPPMPVMPAVPVIPAVPSPVPVFSDYDSTEAFEIAMEAWGETMEVWGEDVGRQFEGDWEDRMEAWGEEMEVWGETVEEMAENIDENEFERLAELKGLAGLAGLENLKNLKSLEGLSGLAQISELNDEALRHALQQSQNRIERDLDREIERAQRQAERTQREADQVLREKASLERKVDEMRRKEASLQRERDQALREEASRLREKDQVRRQIAEAKRAEHDILRAGQQAEREVARAQRNAERAQHQAERAQARAEAVSHRTHTSSSTHSKQTVTVSGAEPGETVVINGRTLDVDTFRRTVMSALVEDGLIQRGDRSATLSMCGDTLEVDGRTASRAQTKRYVKIFENAGLDMMDSLVVKLNPDVLTLSMSGNGDKDGQRVSVGTFNHTDTK